MARSKSIHSRYVRPTPEELQAERAKALLSVYETSGFYKSAQPIIDTILDQAKDGDPDYVRSQTVLLMRVFRAFREAASTNYVWDQPRFYLECGCEVTLLTDNEGTTLDVNYCNDKHLEISNFEVVADKDDLLKISKGNHTLACPRDESCQCVQDMILELVNRT